MSRFILRVNGEDIYTSSDIKSLLINGTPGAITELTVPDDEQYILNLVSKGGTLIPVASVEEEEGPEEEGEKEDPDFPNNPARYSFGN